MPLVKLVHASYTNRVFPSAHGHPHTGFAAKGLFLSRR